jgi:putative redox protein
MGTKVNASLEFKAGFDGQLNLRSGSIGIGMADDQARPYDLLQGALVSCLHSTFLDILTKKRLALPSAKYEVEGEKRESIPTTLERVTITVTLPAGQEAEYTKAMALAQKYCSVFNTLSHVATLKVDLHFETT